MTDILVTLNQMVFRSLAWERDDVEHMIRQIVAEREAHDLAMAKVREQRDAEKARADAAGRALAGLIGANFPSTMHRLDELLREPGEPYDYSPDDFRAAIHALALFCVETVDFATFRRETITAIAKEAGLPLQYLGSALPDPTKGPPP